MSKRRINLKRVKDALIWLSLIAGISALLFFAVLRKSNATIKTMVVHIDDRNGSDQLISEKEVIQILNLAAGKTISKTNIKKLDIRKLEAKLNKDKRIERADIYFDSKDRLNVSIIQKKPLMRVVDEAGGEYYLDENGKQVPVTRGSAVRVPVVTGVRDTFHSKFLISEKPSKLKDIFYIMKYVSQDEFLSALIEQAHIENDSIGDIVLIPKIGREKLIFGDGKNVEEKFDKLKIFYRDGLPKLGWSRYKTLNLKYANQVSGMLVNPASAKRIEPVLKDSLQVALITTDNNKQSIQH